MITFSYNGVSSNTYDIVAKSVNRPILPALRKRELAVPGKHGVYDFSDNTFDKRIITVEIKYVGTSFSNLRSKAREIAAWLSGYNGSQKLIFSDEPAKYYNAKIYSEIGLSNLFLVGAATLQFECEPFAYNTSSSVYTFTFTADVTATFTNAGTFNARPTIDITGSFLSLTITQGTATLTYTAEMTTSQTFSIDSENYLVTLGTTNKMTELSGTATVEFIDLSTGSNTLYFAGGTTPNATITIGFIEKFY